MGCSVYARAIIGVKLPQAPFEEVKRRGCSHKLSSSTSQFCGKCGASSWDTISEPVSGYDEERGGMGALSVAKGGNCDHVDYYVGLHRDR